MDFGAKLSRLRAAPTQSPRDEGRAALTPPPEARGPASHLDATSPLPPRGAGPSAGAPAPEARGPAGLTATPGPHGLLHAARRTFPFHARHGATDLSAARRVAPASLSTLALDPRLAQVDLSRVLFVDTETTGLHGGAGTLPFLIGLGWFDGDALQVEQLFLPRPGHEGPMLRRLAERLEAASLMVTFNGKSFDWPLLRTRLVMNRLPAPAAPLHLDLLHCARRLFRRRLGATRLVDLERRVLGFHRVGDIDGGAIPLAYFDYLRRGVTALITQVLEHNALDVVSMAAVLAELGRRVQVVHDDDPPEDCLSLAELSVRTQDLGRAEALAVRAAERTDDDSTALDAWWLAARLAGRRRDWATVVHRLNTALGLPRLPREAHGQLHLALARVCEHQLKNRARALEHAVQGAAAEDAAAHAKRVARLQRAPRAAGVQRPFDLG